MKPLRQYGLVVLFVSLLVTLGGCIALLTPKVETNFDALRAGEYRLDPSHASLLFKIRHLGLSTYVGRFNEFDATLTFDPENMASAKLEAIIDMTSIDLNDASFEQTIQGGTWLNTRAFAQARFSSQQVIPIDDSRFDFIGLLQWRGQQQEIRVSATFEGGAFDLLTQSYKLGFAATTQFKRSEFGMGAFVPIVGDEVTIEAFVEFKRESSRSEPPQG